MDRSDEANVSGDTRRRRWLKRHITHRVPLPGLWRFLYMYVLRLGVLDGRAGLEFCRFIAHYDSMVAMKLRYLLRQHRRGQDVEAALSARPSQQAALAVPEGGDGAAEAAPATELDVAQLSGSANDCSQSGSCPPMQMHPEASSWSFAGKVARAVWMLLGRPLFRISFHNWYLLRSWLLRLFGAKIGRRVAIRPTVNIEVPWMLEIEDDVTIGDHAILYSLGRIRIGKRSIISQYAHLCAGTHDYTNHRFPLLRSPVTIGKDAWIGADVFVGPGVTVGDLSVVGARSNVFKDLPEGKVCVGNPAKPVKDRVLR